MMSLPLNAAVRAAQAIGAAAVLAAGSPSVFAAPQSRDTFEAVRAADLRIATYGWRLASANAALCDRVEPGTGLQLHTLDQFDSGSRAAAEAHFGFAGPVAVEAVVPDSPAARAGVVPDDSIVRAGPVVMATLPGRRGTTERLVAAQLALAALPPAAPLELDVIRAGKPLSLVIQPAPACRSRFELLLGGGFKASADGTMVQIGSGFLDSYPDEQVAAVIAHEFAHNILHHRDRLEARGVAWGMLAGFGGNVKYFRQTEIQADLLSVYLLNNAGYAPRGSLAFWRNFGPSKAGGILRSRSHPAWRDRVATLEAEIAKIEPISARPIVPGLIAERSQPLSGDWQSLLVRAR